MGMGVMYGWKRVGVYKGGVNVVVNCCVML